MDKEKEEFKFNDINHRKTINMHDTSLIIFWIAMWGLVDVIMIKYFGTHIDAKLVFFIILIIISFVLNYYSTKYNI